MTPERERFDTVYGWICEARGVAEAHAWAWSCTPFPCGYPSEEQLEEGMAIATGELTLNDVMAKVEAEMKALMDEHRRTRDGEAQGLPAGHP